MKRKMFSIMAIAAVALVSCKKEEPATSELGMATINGNVWADLDQTDDFQNGVYVQELNPEGVEGMQVSIEVNTSNWVQNQVSGYDYEVKTYTATTDANGDWTIEIPATEDAYTVTIQYNDVYTTRTVLAEDGVSGITENVELSYGSHNVTVFAGAEINEKIEANISTLGAGAMNYGTAKVFGTVYVNWNDGNSSTGFYELGDVSSPLAGMNISWAYYDGPYGDGENVWSDVAIAADGTYEIELTTEGAGMGTVGIDFGFYDFIADQVTDLDFDGNDENTPSIYSVGGIDGEGQCCLEAGELQQYDIYVNVSNL